jgi:hypothetical protein
MKKKNIEKTIRTILYVPVGLLVLYIQDKIGFESTAIALIFGLFVFTIENSFDQDDKQQP